MSCNNFSNNVPSSNSIQYSWNQQLWNQSNCLPLPPFMPSSVVGNLAPCPTYQHPPMMNPPMFPCYSYQQFPPTQSNHHQNKRQYQHNNNYDLKSKKIKEVFIDFCDVCDRGFKTEEKRKQHYSEHTKCSEPDCQFEAHFKIVEIHKRNVHGRNGIRIQLTTHDEIRKWREERKKNFPTAQRIKEKLHEEASKEISGAVLEKQSFGKFRQRGNGRSFTRGRGGKFNNKRGKYNRGRNMEQNSCESIKKDSADHLTKQSPTCDKLVYEQSTNPMDFFAKSTETDEVAAGASIGKESSESVVQPTGQSLSSLGQLISNYVSDNDVTDDETADQRQVEESDVSGTHASPVGDSSQCSNGAEGNENRHCDVTERDKQYSNKRNRNKRHEKAHHPVSKTRPSLLRMLLEPEIRRERNDILQCVRYIVSRNFFDVAAT